MGKKKRKGVYVTDLSDVEFNMVIVDCWNHEVSMWECECDCGNRFYLPSSRITNEKLQPYSCGCTTKTDAKYQQMIGYKFDKLTVVELIKSPTQLASDEEQREWSKKNGKVFLCQCDCGGRAIKTLVELEKETKTEKSCGCVKVDRSKFNGSRTCKNRPADEWTINDMTTRFTGKKSNGLIIRLVRKGNNGKAEFRLLCPICGYHNWYSLEEITRGRFTKCECK